MTTTTDQTSRLRVYPELVQGSDAWLDVRRGIVTASVVGQLVSTRPPSGLAYLCPECGAEPESPCVSRARRDAAPIRTLHSTRVPPAGAPPIVEVADNDTSRALTTLLAAERITGWSDPVYVSHDMLRGTLDEPVARDLYSQHIAPVRELGFMVRNHHGHPIGYSPDGLVGDDGLIEIKSRRQKKHLATILADEVPAENVAQIQSGLLVSGRAWCDYVSFCGGMPLYVKRVEPDQRWFDAITAAVDLFERTVADMVATYHRSVAGLPATERTTYDMDLVI
jgi:hypothetical protein